MTEQDTTISKKLSELHHHLDHWLQSHIGLPLLLIIMGLVAIVYPSAVWELISDETEWNRLISKDEPNR